MRLTTSGIPYRRSDKAIVGKVTHQVSLHPVSERASRVYVGSLDQPSEALGGYLAVLSEDLAEIANSGRISEQTPIIHSLRHSDHFRDDDIVSLDLRDGFVRTVFRPDSAHNTLFMTERCNSNCLMCSQPPKDSDDTEHLFEINRNIIRFIQPTTENITITGGEPTLLGERLYTLLTDLKHSLPTTHIHMLTNGRLFAWGQSARSLAEVCHPSLSVGIPLYSDFAQDHDHIVQAKSAFDQTVLGLHQLARWRVSTEIRVVLHKLSVPRLPQLAEFITRNFPFVSHVALMGLEPTGYTPRNRALLWIDPVEYQAELEQAVETLSFGGIRVSIYNSQLCLLRPQLWRFARKSISDWKNIYLDACTRCSQLDRCGGLFVSAEKMHSAHIRPLTAANEVT